MKTSPLAVTPNDMPMPIFPGTGAVPDKALRMTETFLLTLIRDFEPVEGVAGLGVEMTPWGGAGLGVVGASP
jgi:hypothetical protein